MGEEIRVGLFESWKHIEIGEFDVVFEQDEDTELLCRTSEGLSCLVSARFRFKIPAAEDVLREISELSPPTRIIEKAITLEEIRKGISDYCESATRDQISHLKYVSLLEPDSLKEHQEKLRFDLQASSQDRGINLLHGNVAITPLDPLGIGADSNIVSLWLKYQKVKEDRQLETERMKLESRKRLEEIKAEYTLEDKKRELELLQQQSILNQKKERINRDNEEIVRKIRDEIGTWDEQAKINWIENEAILQKRKSETEASVKAERDRLTLEERRRVLELIDVEREIETKKAASNELRYENSKIELKIQWDSAEFFAARIKAEAEAAVSGQLLIQKQMIDAMPEMLREAAKPLSQIGDIHVLVMDQSKESADGQSYLHGLTALPLLGNMIKTIGNWIGLEKVDSHSIPENKTSESRESG